jgi:hypothetical protein
MYSSFLLFLFFIAQIAAAEALAHGRHPRFNHGDNPNVSASALRSQSSESLTGRLKPTQVQWMMSGVRHTRHGSIYRPVPDPTPNGQGDPGFDLSALKNPIFMSKALVSAVLLAYFAIALGYAIRYHRRKSHSHGLDATRLPTCCESSCADCHEA